VSQRQFASWLAPRPDLHGGPVIQPLPVGTVAATKTVPVGLGEVGYDGIGTTLAKVHADDHLRFEHRHHVGKIVLFRHDRKRPTCP
jgi:hypothetical protein